MMLTGASEVSYGAFSYGLGDLLGIKALSHTHNDASPPNTAHMDRTGSMMCNHDAGYMIRRR